jgi:hypothetical protein
VLGSVLAACLLLPYAYTFAQVWSVTGSDLEFVADEQDGVTYLRPLAALVGATTLAQSAAVRGEPVDIAVVQAAVGAVDRADAEVGAALGVRERWADAKQRLVGWAGRPGSGATALAGGGQVLDLLQALTAHVGDASRLILDPQLDSYYVMDAVLLRVPAMLVQAGRMSDQRFLARNGATPTGVIVAQENLRSQASALDAGLRKSFSVSSSRTLGPALLSVLDTLQAVVNGLAPPTAQVGSPPVVPPATQLRAAQGRLQDAALRLEAAGLQELASLLRARSDAATGERRLVLLAGGAGAALALAVLWFGTGAARRPVVEEPEEAPPLPADTAGEAAAADLLDARELLGTRQLVRVGRAVAPTRSDT